MSLRTAIFLLPLVAFGQVPAPQPSPESDAALRAHVSEFFQDFVDGKFRAAMDLVAEDTQEEYFASGKAQIKEFKITKINYEPSLEKANVVLLVKRVWNIQGHPQDVDTDMSTVWILEKGKWVWTHQRDPNLWDTPMGPSNIDLVKQNATGAVTGIPRNITPEAVNAAGKKIMQQGGFDKAEVTLPADKPSSEKVVFHNAAQGSIQLQMQAPAIAGFSAKLNKTTLNFAEDAVLELSYQPPPNASPEALPKTGVVQLSVIPFNQSHQVTVNYGAK